MARERRIGLVLGAGGIMGGAWLTGALSALAAETGWDPGSADRIVGTSAGSMIGALCAAGVPPWFMVAHSAGESFDGLTDARGRPAGDADRSAGAVFRLQRALPPLGPGSWELVARTLTRPTRFPPTALGAGWLPRGFISTEPLKETVRRAVPGSWVDHDRLWIVACDYASGRRVAFGRDDAPTAQLADAVAASCAIPGFYHPVTIRGRRYVDGGLWSSSNLDVVRGDGLDLVICLNPTSSLSPSPGRGPADRLSAFVRIASGRRLGHESRKLRDEGVEVVQIQPTLEDLAAMGGNLMRSSGRHRVIETAQRTVAAQLREDGVREHLGDMPPGEAHKLRRPDGPVADWPELVGSAPA